MGQHGRKLRDWKSFFGGFLWYMQVILALEPSGTVVPRLGPTSFVFRRRLLPSERLKLGDSMLYHVCFRGPRGARLELEDGGFYRAPEKLGARVEIVDGVLEVRILNRTHLPHLSRLRSGGVRVDSVYVCVGLWEERTLRWVCVSEHAISMEKGSKGERRQRFHEVGRRAEEVLGRGRRSSGTGAGKVEEAVQAVLNTWQVEEWGASGRMRIIEREQEEKRLQARLVEVQRELAVLRDRNAATQKVHTLTEEARPPPLPPSPSPSSSLPSASSSSSSSSSTSTPTPTPASPPSTRMSLRRRKGERVQVGTKRTYEDAGFQVEYLPSTARRADDDESSSSSSRKAGKRRMMRDHDGYGGERRKEGMGEEEGEEEEEEEGDEEDFVGIGRTGGGRRGESREVDHGYGGDSHSSAASSGTSTSTGMLPDRIQHPPFRAMLSAAQQTEAIAHHHSPPISALSLSTSAPVAYPATSSSQFFPAFPSASGPVAGTPAAPSPVSSMTDSSSRSTRHTGSVMGHTSRSGGAGVGLGVGGSMRGRSGMQGLVLASQLPPHADTMPQNAALALAQLEPRHPLYVYFHPTHPQAWMHPQQVPHFSQHPHLYPPHSRPEEGRDRGEGKRGDEGRGGKGGEGEG